MKYISLKDKRRRLLVEKYELEKLRTKALAYNLNLPFTIRYLYNNKRFNYILNASKVRLKNRCLVTNRSQSVYRVFSLNRVTIREMSGQNLLQGVKKSSW